MSELPWREVLISASKNAPSGHGVAFAGAFELPPTPGTRILLTRGQKKTVATSTNMDVGIGTGAAASASVLHALGFQPKQESTVRFRQATPREWWKHAPGAKWFMAGLGAEAAFAIGAVLVAALSVLNSPAIPIVVAAISVVLVFATYLVARSRYQAGMR
jgi:hypothetical protein